MKKTISVAMVIFIMITMLSLFSVPTMAEETDVPEEKVLIMYVSDSGLDTNDGQTADTPMQTIKAVVNKMKSTIGNGMGTYNCGKIVLCGDSTITASTDLGAHTFPLTITSSDKAGNKLILKQTFRLGGETLFTDIKIITAVNDKFLWADGCKLTMGKPGVKDDVVTYDKAAGSVEALTVVGGFAGASPASVSIDVTINSGTYKAFHTGEGTYGAWINGDVNFVINDATMTDGVISMGGIYKSSAGIAGSFMSGGNYTLTINGGKFDKTTISIGWAGTIDKARTLFGGELVLSAAGEPTKNIFGGDVLVDINGGTFTGTSKIGKGSSLDSEMGGVLDFRKSVTIDTSDIPNADKEKYKSLVVAADQDLLIEHTLDTFVKVDDDTHKVYCDCGCSNERIENHDWDDGVITILPTHTVDGVKTYTCVDCMATKTEVVPADQNTHYYGDWEKYNETQHKHVCTDTTCDHTEYADHTWDDGIVTTEPTHTTEGVRTFTCTACGETRTEAIEKTSTHSMGEWERYDSNQHRRVCECGEAKYADHVWDSGEITKQATVDEEGVKTYTCTVCGETKTEVIEKLEPTDSDTQQGKGCKSNIGTSAITIIVSSIVSVFILMPVISKKKKSD